MIYTLNVFLADGAQEDGGRSTLSAAINDARATMDKGGLWLGTLGYLIILESVGKSLSRPRTGFRNRDDGATARFVAGAREFAPKPVTKKQAETLYGLRCSLSHSFDLRNYGRHAIHYLMKRTNGFGYQHTRRTESLVPTP